MPVRVAKRGGRYRVVERNGRVSRAKKKSGKKGKSRDGGGYASKKKAQALAGAINRNL